MGVQYLIFEFPNFYFAKFYILSVAGTRGNESKFGIQTRVSLLDPVDPAEPVLPPGGPGQVQVRIQRGQGQGLRVKAGERFLKKIMHRQS